MAKVDIFSVTSHALRPGTRVLAFEGTEAISTLYHFEIHLFIDDPDFDMSAAIGADATLSINADEERPYVFHGVFSSFETVADLDGGSIYRAEMVPRCRKLASSQHCRIFVNETIPEILESLLREGGITDYSLKLTAQYPRLEHLCQYRESGFAFLSRRLEREGIYYFFEQGEDREHLVFTDDHAVHRPYADTPVHYVRVGGRGAAGLDGLSAFTCKRTSLVGSVHVSDRDYLRPALDVSGVAKVSEGGEELHLYGENPVTPADSERLAQVRAEELKAREVMFRGAGRVFTLRPGYVFSLEDHPRNGVDGAYLVTELKHRGSAAGGFPEAKEILGIEDGEAEIYHAEVIAIPKGVPFRPERRTAIPRIYGMERAVIDGAEDTDYAQLDEHGRYLVKVHFDESPLKDGKASARIRMMQPHGGNPESFHFPLRKGTEVMLSFEGGDPDRPVIAGVVPNLATPSAITSKNSTKNIIHTGGGNRIVIEDQEGKQYIHLATPHKRTYLHLGSPFNPQYNKITNTDGTSLSFTSDISTSFTGTDAETIVEDSRVTIIGRSRMNDSDPRGQEIGRLLGMTFIQLLDAELALERAQFQQATDDANDAKGLATTASTAAATAAANPTNTGDWTTATAAIAAAFGPPSPSPIDTMLTDAQTWESAHAGDPAAEKWLSDCKTAQQNAAAVVAAVAAAGSPPTQTQLNLVSSTAITAAKAVATAVSDIPFASKLPKLPPAPAPSLTATYINLPHGAQQILDQTAGGAMNPTVTIDSTLELETSDPTAMDMAGPTAPPLNPGSDVKIVGGDNVTMVAKDARSHISGTSYGLVQSGQASVVRGGQQSKVFSPNLSGSGAIISAPTTFTPLSFPLPTTPDDPNAAQRSEIYGNQFSWVNGDVNATITGKKTTVVNNGVDSTIKGGQTSNVSGGQSTSVDHKETYAGNSLTAVGHSTTFYGAKEALGVAALNFVVMSLSYEMYKLHLGINNVSVTVTAISAAATHISQYGVNLRSGPAAVATHEIHLLTSILHAIQ